MTRARLTGTIALAGLLLLGHGLWIPAKAALAQRLLDAAWRRTQQGERAVRPWPWADTWPVARLRVPDLGVSVVVLAGATGRTLAFGPGHVAGSAEPGTPGNTVLAGHRDTHFRFLRDLEEGQELVLETRDDQPLHFRVLQRRVVHERDTAPLAPTPEAVLTLVTCFPFDSPVPLGPERFVVTARGASEARAPAQAASVGGPSASWER